MNITIAFYKGRGDILNKIVRWWTKVVKQHGNERSKNVVMNVVGNSKCIRRQNR